MQGDRAGMAVTNPDGVVLVSEALRRDTWLPKDVDEATVSGWLRDGLITEVGRP